MGLYLLDSDAVIDFLNGIPSSASLLHSLVQSGDYLAVCDIVIAEVFSGTHPQNRPPAIRFLSAVRFLPASLAIGRQAGEWRYLYARRGIQLATADTVIAATAHAHNATIITRNLKDFPMPEVTIRPLPSTSAH
jgi:predicted nucleic acid-binding protein